MTSLKFWFELFFQARKEVWSSFYYHFTIQAKCLIKIVFLAKIFRNYFSLSFWSLNVLLDIERLWFVKVTWFNFLAFWHISDDFLGGVFIFMQMNQPEFALLSDGWSCQICEAVSERQMTLRLKDFQTYQNIEIFYL